MLFLLLVVALSATSILYQHGDIVIGVLLFLAPYAAACIAVAYRIAERLASEEWVEPSYPEEPASEELAHTPEHGRLALNPYAGNEPVLLRKRVEEAGRQHGEEEDPCGDIDILEVMEKLDRDPKAREQLHMYMECRARWFLERFHEWEKQHGLRVEER